MTLKRGLSFMSSPPPMSPLVSRSLGSSSINEMVASLRNLLLGKVTYLPSSWNVQVGSPRFVSSRGGSTIRPGFRNLPSPLTRIPARTAVGFLDFYEEEPPMEGVESGRDLRVKMFERLREEELARAGRSDPGPGLF